MTKHGQVITVRTRQKRNYSGKYIKSKRLPTKEAEATALQIAEHERMHQEMLAGLEANRLRARKSAMFKNASDEVIDFIYRTSFNRKFIGEDGCKD